VLAEARLTRISYLPHEDYVGCLCLTSSKAFLIGRAATQDGPHGEICIVVAEHREQQEQVPFNGEWDAIIRFFYTMQPFFESGSRDVALVPIIVALPPIDDVDAMNVVAPVQQYSTDWPMPQPKSSTRAPRCKGFPSHSRNRKCALIESMIASHYRFLCSKTTPAELLSSCQAPLCELAVHSREDGDHAGANFPIRSRRRVRAGRSTT